MSDKFILLDVARLLLALLHRFRWRGRVRRRPQGARRLAGARHLRRGRPLRLLGNGHVLAVLLLLLFRHRETRQKIQVFLLTTTFMTMRHAVNDMISENLINFSNIVH